MKKISLIALDMDGTLFDSYLNISPGNQQAIRNAISAGKEVIISTGRPYHHIPIDLLAGLGVHYAITVNGAALYTLPGKECIFESCIPYDVFLPIIQKLQKYDIIVHIFLDGYAFSQRSKHSVIDNMKISDRSKKFLLEAGETVEDLAAFLEERHCPVQKASVNFYPLADGTYKDFYEVSDYLCSHPMLSVASGGYHNLEFTLKGLSKATGLAYLAHKLGLSMEQTMAIGDSENDLDIIASAGVGVAMANAEPCLKEKADFITLSNDEDGVAYALRKFAE